MKNILISSNNLNIVFQQIEEQLGGKLEKKSKEFKLEINNDIATGCILGMLVENAISYMEYDIVFKENVSFVKKIHNLDSIHFGYCSRGRVTQSFGEFTESNKLSQFQTGIFTNSSTKSTFFKFIKNEEVKFSLITIDILSISDKKLKKQLQNTFLINEENSVFSYIGSFNLKIAEKIESLNRINQKGLIRNFLINSNVYLILALEIEQYNYDLNNAKTTNNSLTRSDMEAIKDVSEFIRNYPEIHYSIRYLSKKSGLSPFKLQEGFKIMHNRTVTDFIRNIRIEAAENLIRTSELNISEIVYTIGLTNRSYFSKIFKAKYKCSPKHYQNQQNRLVITT